MSQLYLDTSDTMTIDGVFLRKNTYNDGSAEFVLGIGVACLVLTGDDLNDLKNLLSYVNEDNEFTIEAEEVE